MHSSLTAHLKHLTISTIAGSTLLLGVTAILPGAVGGPLAAGASCGCELTDMACHTSTAGLYKNGSNPTVCTEMVSAGSGDYELEGN